MEYEEENEKNRQRKKSSRGIRKYVVNKNRRKYWGKKTKKGQKNGEEEE
jgi:hypothetical protein